MSAAQPPVVASQLSPPPPPMVVAPRSLASELARWTTGGILIGMPLGVILGIVLGLFGVSGFFAGVAVGGLVGLAVGAILVSSRRHVPGYGSAKRVLRSGAVSTWIHVAGLAASIGVGLLGAGPLGGIEVSSALSAAGAMAMLAAVLLFVGAVLSPERDYSNTTALVVSPILFLLGLGLWSVFRALAGDPESGSYVPPPEPDTQVAETAPPPFGAPDEEAATNPADRMPTPALLVSNEWDLNTLMQLLADEADAALEVAVVEDPDIPSGTRFLPTAVYCQWQQNEHQATIDIWFDTADDNSAMFRLRDYWMTQGYLIVMDDPDLIVVHGVDGSVGAQYSVEKTWDDELRLRMLTACTTH